MVGLLVWQATSRWLGPRDRFRRPRAVQGPFPGTDRSIHGRGTQGWGSRILFLISIIGRGGTRPAESEPAHGARARKPLGWMTASCTWKTCLLAGFAGGMSAQR